jgi:hypothetical protein
VQNAKTRSFLASTQPHDAGLDDTILQSINSWLEVRPPAPQNEAIKFALLNQNSDKYEAARQMRGAVANIAIIAAADAGTAITTAITTTTTTSV